MPKVFKAPPGFVLNPDYLVPELRAQRDALLEALHAIVRRVNDAASYRMGSDIDALARAAIKAVEEGENHAKRL